MRAFLGEYIRFPFGDNYHTGKALVLCPVYSANLITWYKIRILRKMPCFIQFFYSLFLRYFALGLLYHSNGQDSVALQVCTVKISILLVLTEEWAQDNVQEYSFIFLTVVDSCGRWGSAGLHKI